MKFHIWIYVYLSLQTCCIGFNSNILNQWTGSYFAPYYYMGNEKFQTTQPESYLFGDNVDLQYLGPKAQNVIVWLL